MVLAVAGVVFLGGGIGLAVAASASPSAMVLAVTPDVWVERDGESIPLTPKMNLEVGDTVVSNATGKAQILFADDSAVTLSPSTSLSVADFVYDESGNAADDRVALNLGAGMARFLTGEVARRNPQGVAVHTRQATIGIRGTMFTVHTTGELTTAVLLETSGAGLNVTNVATGAVATLQMVGNAVDVGPLGTQERPATPAEMAASSQATRNVGTGSDTGTGVTGPPETLALNTGATGGLSPAGSAADSPLALFEPSTDNMETHSDPVQEPGLPPLEPSPLPPGLDISAISGAFMAPSLSGTANFSPGGPADYTGSVYFEVDGMANITAASIGLSLDSSYGGAHSGNPSAEGGTGTIMEGGAFSVGGFTLYADGAYTPESATLNGQFDTTSSGTLNWGMELSSSYGSPPEGTATVGGSGVPFQPGGS